MTPAAFLDEATIMKKLVHRRLVRIVTSCVRLRKFYSMQVYNESQFQMLLSEVRDPRLQTSRFHEKLHAGFSELNMQAIIF